jgi:peptidoglycan/LPS O-acetylase OafA/YrhL
MRFAAFLAGVLVFLWARRRRRHDRSRWPQFI